MPAQIPGGHTIGAIATREERDKENQPDGLFSGAHNRDVEGGGETEYLTGGREDKGIFRGVDPEGVGEKGWGF